MNTPAHLIFGAAAFGNPDRRGTLTAALLGGLTPDLSLYLLVGWHLSVLETAPQVVFDTLYFSETWQRVFAVDNSLVLWSAAFGIALWRHWPVMTAFTGTAALHILFDLPLHAGDGRPHLWPLTGWVFDSPVSYWDSRFGARWIGPLEPAASAALVSVLWWRVRAWVWRGLFAVLLLAEVASTNIWFLLL